MIDNIYYRVSNETTQQGLWYDKDGNFTGLIHTKFNSLKNSNLPMPYDENIVGYLSVVKTLEELFNWFSKDDIKELEKHGWYVYKFEATIVKEYQNHYIICEKTSIIKERIFIS